MRFADTGIPAPTLRALAGMVDSGRIPHALLLSEPDGGPAFGLALAFLQYLYCPNRPEGDSCGECPSCNRVSKLIHPDIRFIFPTTAGQSCISLMPALRELVAQGPRFTEAALGAALGVDGKSSLIPVAESKEILSGLSLSALEGGWRSVVIYMAEKMNQEAANRLLKAIEEPDERTLFILITHAPEKVLQTIRSRCLHIQLGAEIKAPDFDSPELLDSLMDALVRRDLPAALEASEHIAALPSRESAKAFCKYSSDAMRNLFLVQQGLDLPHTASGNARAWAAGVRKSFPRNALDCFDTAMKLLDRNVNAKIVFTDMADKLYTFI